jgi:hypothetical protein
MIAYTDEELDELIKILIGEHYISSVSYRTLFYDKLGIVSYTLMIYGADKIDVLNIPIEEVPMYISSESTIERLICNWRISIYR